MSSRAIGTDSGVVRYKKLGSTTLEISSLSFGASPLGNVFGAVDVQEGKRAVHFAVDNGINFFDVSPYYGRTLAEERLGDALVDHRHQVLLATKCGRYGIDQFDFSAERVRSSVDESLKRLRSDYVDLLQVHDVEFGDVQQIVDETLPAIRRIQEEGKTRFVGITGYSLKTLVSIAEAAPVDTILTYCRCNLMNDDADRLLMPFAKKHRIGVINASPLHMGVLTKAGPPDWHPAPAEVLEAASKAQELCRANGVDISQVALRLCFDHPYVSTTLVGMSSQKQVEVNLRALQETVDPKLMTSIEEILAPVFGCVWPSGHPENQDAVTDTAPFRTLAGEYRRIAAAGDPELER